MAGETETIERAGWMPRFTIRTLLAICTACAVASVIIGTAFRGQYWAWGVTIGLFSLVVTALLHSAWFGFLWLFARAPERHRARFPNMVLAPNTDSAAAVHDNSDMSAGGNLDA